MAYPSVPLLNNLIVNLFYACLVKTKLLVSTIRILLSRISINLFSTVFGYRVTFFSQNHMAFFTINIYLSHVHEVESGAGDHIRWGCRTVPSQQIK